MIVFSRFRFASCLLLSVILFLADAAAQETKPFRLGIIGTTTSHVPAFIGIINHPEREGIYRQFEIVAAYAGGMPDNPASWDRVEEYKKGALEKGVVFYPSIEEMLPQVDGILLESVDGRCHLEQAKPVIAAGKPLFIDKPMTACLADAVVIFRLAEEKGVAVFSSSSLRFSSGFQSMRTNPSVGPVLGAAAWGPSSRNPSNPGFFWYGIHGVETLFTIMGQGCEEVACVGSDDYDLASGIWSDGRIGTFRGSRGGKGGYGATVYGAQGAADAGKYEGYKPLAEAICRFFSENKPPVEPRETLEILAFMEAAEESLALDGKSVRIAETMKRAENEKSVLVRLRLAADRSLTLEGKAVGLDNVPRSLDTLGENETRVRVVLSAEKGYDPALLNDVCRQIGYKRLVDFLY